MISKYVYRHKKTGSKIYTNKKMDDPAFELVREVRGGPIDKNKIINKTNEGIHDENQN